MERTTLLLLAILLALSLVGCTGEQTIREFCSSDANCKPGYRCDRSTGLCLCASDSVCGPDEYCAPDGLCRRRMACDTNADCPPDTFCDTTTGNCIERAKCTTDVQCPFGQICSSTYFRCVTGCRVSGDCALGGVCLDGECQQGLCLDRSYCAYGQLCDTTTHTCYDDTRGPYCKSCGSGTLYEPNSCDSGPDFCLITAGDLTLPPYCGVDCDQGQPCPNGYNCFPVRIVYTRDNCSSNDQCTSGTCFIREGDQLGFCLCSADNQCPQDSCDDTFMQCRITARPCTPGGNECDRPVFCIDGFCVIGRNCKPIEGLHCDDILH